MLDACDPAEEAAITEHLRDCPRCRAELAAHLEVAGVLGNLGGEAPEGLWDRIWTEIASPTRLDSLSDGPSSTTRIVQHRRRILHRPSLSSKASKAPIRDRSRLASPAPNLCRRLPPPELRDAGCYALAAGAVAAALAVAVGVLGTTVGNLNNQVSALNKAVVTGGVRGAEQAALAEPNHKAVRLMSTSHDWSANLVVSPSLEAFIVPEKMPSIPASKTFQAWAVVHGKFVSLGVLGRSSAIHQLLLQPDMTAILVNTEPLGGTSQPTTPPLLRGNLPPAL